MPEQKKRGFRALEQRIHELEAEDARRERGSSGEREVAPRAEPGPPAPDRGEQRKE
jgi:hypothetical protein